MTSKRQREANSKNAVRSTGPRSQRGKARSSRNATRHGLAKRFGTDAADIRNIERLATGIAASNVSCSKQMARAAASAQLELAHIRKIRADICDVLAESINQTGSDSSVLTILMKAEAIDRYEKRAISRFWRVIRTLRPKVD